MRSTTVFVDLHERGLIYRDRRLINWCPRCETALSDLEVDHKDAKSSLWYIRYPFADGAGSITVATTRPETMLGDTAVAVNPSDARYTALVGRALRLPLMNREIKIIADAAVDPEFGTGAVKITPAHDLNDFEIGRRHNLEQISVMDSRARMNDEAGAYQGLERDAARAQIVDDLEAQGFIEKIEPHHALRSACARDAIPSSSRCSPSSGSCASRRWRERAMEAVRDGRHHLPSEILGEHVISTGWKTSTTGASRVSYGGGIGFPPIDATDAAISPSRPSARPSAKNAAAPICIQEEDVLDTWFSSALWPFSTLGWPDDTPELAKYYPTSLLITGFDIIFFWVARMMMIGLECTDKVPFRDVYITPLVRDQYGKKMTKSRGNVVDPLEIMDQYGTDAVRLTLAQLACRAATLILSARSTGGLARVRQQTLERRALRDDEPRRRSAAASRAGHESSSRWPSDGFSRRLDSAVARGHAPRSMRTNSTSPRCTLYEFIWHEFCDWYIELAKEPLKAGGERQAAARWVLVRCFDAMLRLLHPFMPFISEEIWQVMRPYMDEPSPGAASGDREISRVGCATDWLRRKMTRRWNDVSRRPRRSIRCAHCSAIIRASA